MQGPEVRAEMQVPACGGPAGRAGVEEPGGQLSAAHSACAHTRKLCVRLASCDTRAVRPCQHDRRTFPTPSGAGGALGVLGPEPSDAPLAPGSAA